MRLIDAIFLTLLAGMMVAVPVDRVLGAGSSSSADRAEASPSTNSHDPHAHILDDPAPAGANFEIRWQTIDAGATFATGGNYQLRGTIGQPDADPAHPAQSPEFTHTGGFWTILTGSGQSVVDLIFRDRFSD